MAKTRIDNFRIGEQVLITSYNPPIEAKIADMYELPFEQVPMTDKQVVEKYYGKNIPIIEVFIDGKVRSFVKLEGFNARYETSAKRLYVETDLTDEQFLNKLATYKNSEIITNPYSGEKAELEPLAVALYDFIKGCEITNNYDNMRRALRIFAERWTREYYILLD